MPFCRSILGVRALGVACLAWSLPQLTWLLASVLTDPDVQALADANPGGVLGLVDTLLRTLWARIGLGSVSSVLVAGAGVLLLRSAVRLWPIIRRLEHA